MRILILSQFCEPETHMTRAALFARALAAEGHEVQILTGFPNYPGGKVYPGYRIRFLQRETLDGVSILRVPLYPSHDASSIRRILNYASFAASASILGSLFASRPDIIYVWHPPLTIGLAARVLSLTKRAPFVYDIQDLWPDTLAATGTVRSRWVLALIAKVGGWVYRHAGFLVVQSPGFKRVLSARGVPEDKIEVIYNWSHEGHLRLGHSPQIREQINAGQRFNVVFAGSMGRAQGLRTVLEAAKLLESSRPNVQVVLVGAGVEVGNLQEAAAELGVGNVVFLPRMPASEIGRVMEAADVLLVHLRDDRLFEITIPGKTQDYLSVGKPILMAVRGDAAELLAASGGGMCCEPGNPQALAKAVEQLADMEPSQLREMGERGKRFYEAELSLKIGTGRFLNVFHRTLEARADA